MEILVRNEWIWLKRAARMIVTSSDRAAMFREDGQVTTEDGLYVWEAPSRVGEVELPAAGGASCSRGSYLLPSLSPLAGQRENADLVRLLQLCSGGVCRGCCFLGCTAESSHPRMAALKSKRCAASRGTIYI
jgi:hypothetical protein